MEKESDMLRVLLTNALERESKNFTEKVKAPSVREVMDGVQVSIPESPAQAFDNELSGIDRTGDQKYKCAGCGIMTTLPFTPSSNASVFCRDCYAKRRGNQNE